MRLAPRLLQTGCGQSARPAERLLCAAIEPPGSASICLIIAARRTDLRRSIGARSDFRLLRDLLGVNRYTAPEWLDIADRMRRVEELILSSAPALYNALRP